MMSSPHELALGVGAALLSPLMMTFGFIIWDQVWRGSALGLNIFKCSLATLLFCFTIAIFYHAHFPALFSQPSLMLMLSSFLGIVIGDNAWLLALRRIGARRVIVVDAVKPFISSLLGVYLLPSEHMSLQGYAGMAVTITGVLIVSLEQEPSPPQVETGDIELPPAATESESNENSANTTSIANTDFSMGYLLALLNVLFDAYGSVLTKQYGGDITPWDINLIRFGFAAIALWILVVTTQSYQYIHSYIMADKFDKSTFITVAYAPVSSEITTINDSEVLSPVDTLPCFPTSMRWKDWLKIAIGVCFVTYMCPTLNNYALFKMDIGICMTLTSLGPIYSIPLVFIMKKEKSSIRTLLATVMSIVGVGILFIKV